MIIMMAMMPKQQQQQQQNIGVRINVYANRYNRF